jgi:hypothetical protein
MPQHANAFDSHERSDRDGCNVRDVDCEFDPPKRFGSAACRHDDGRERDCPFVPIARLL